MNIISSILLSFCFLSVVIKAQTVGDLNKLQSYYESFQYQSVIAKADSLLNNNLQINEDYLTKINTLKAASHFSLGEQRESRKAFVEILKINKDYQLDSIIYSPKLLSYFNFVKEDFIDITETTKNIDRPDTASINDSATLKERQNIMMSAIAESILLPGLGHLKINNPTKGWLLTAAGSAALGSMIYFIFDTYTKEKNYLKEKNEMFIQSKYDDYNTSYKIRNSLIITYAAIWLYTQIDLLFFTDNLSINHLSISTSKNAHGFRDDDLIVSVQIAF